MQAGPWAAARLGGAAGWRQGGVVGQQQQAYAFERLGRRAASGNVATHHGELGAEIQPMRGQRTRQQVVGAMEDGGIARRQQRPALQVLRQRHLASLGQPLDVAGVGQRTEPAGRPRQRRQAQRGVEREGVAGLAVVERVVEVLQLRADEVPVIERLLQSSGDAGGVVRGAEVTRDDHQLAVAGTVLEGGEFHGAIVYRFLRTPVGVWACRKLGPSLLLPARVHAAITDCHTRG